MGVSWGEISMLTLRSKLAFGYSGLLALLLLVGTFGIVLLNQYSSTLETIFHDNYKSVIFGQDMKEAIDNLDDSAQEALWSHGPNLNRAKSDEFIRNFAAALEAESNNVTFPGEKDIVERLILEWPSYKQEYSDLARGGRSDTESQAKYQNILRPKSIDLKNLAQAIIDINLKNIMSADGRVRENANGARLMMLLLLLSGVVLAIALIALSARSILRPLNMITESAREIQKGNLDLTLPIGAKDELGQLAETFNEMAAKLREFRRSNRAQLFRVEKTTQLALNSFPEAVAVIGLDGKIELANHLAVQRFRLFPGGDLVRHEYKILWSMFQETFATLGPVVSKGYDKAIQLFINGDEYFFLAQTVPIIDESQILNGVTMVLTDVTNLRRIDETKSGMLSVVSHELKTPLTSIRMATHLLLDERIGSLNLKQSELLIAAHDDAERLHRIIENLLDMSQIESGAQRILLEPQPPEKLARESAAPFLTGAREQGIVFINKTSNHLPNVMADVTRIPHVFSNLISNAFKHTTAGGQVIIDAHWQEAEGMVTFSVQNTGATIPAEFFIKVFDRFFRLPNAGGTEGVGLGLAIARDIVNGHGGKIWVENLPAGDGVRFCFTLNAEKKQLPASLKEDV